MHGKSTARGLLALLLAVLMAGAALAGTFSTGRSLLKPSTLNKRAPEVFRVRFETSHGEFVVRVVRSWAPHGADRFYNLCDAGFYDGSLFYRVLEGYIAQFGIPARRQVAKVWWGASIEDDPVRYENTRGTLSYAYAPKQGRTTQLFINLADNHRFDDQGFAPFGKVVEGMDVVDGLYSGCGDRLTMRQLLIVDQGTSYTDQVCPELDYISKTVVLGD